MARIKIIEEAQQGNFSALIIGDLLDFKFKKALFGQDYIRLVDFDYDISTPASTKRLVKLKLSLDARYCSQNHNKTELETALLKWFRKYKIELKDLRFYKSSDLYEVRSKFILNETINEEGEGTQVSDVITENPVIDYGLGVVYIKGKEFKVVHKPDKGSLLYVSDGKDTYAVRKEDLDWNTNN